MKRLLFVPLLAFGMVFGQGETRLFSEEEYKDPCEELEETQVKYELLVKKIRRYYGASDAETLARFNKSQEAYEKFIALEMEAAWPKEEIDGLGSGNQSCPCELENLLYFTRTMFLQTWANGIAEDKCPGAIRINNEE